MSRSRLLSLSLLLAMAASLLQFDLSLLGQEKDGRKKAKGRLPPHYSDLVDGIQREQIYQIQADYEPKIESLLSQIEAIERERDTKVEGVLRPEQLKRLREMQAATEAKRESRAKERGSKEQKSTSDKS